MSEAGTRQPLSSWISPGVGVITLGLAFLGYAWSTGAWQAHAELTDTEHARRLDKQWQAVADLQKNREVNGERLARIEEQNKLMLDMLKEIRAELKAKAR